METWGYQHHISEYSSEVLAPYKSWHPGQLPRLALPVVRSCSQDILFLNQNTFHTVALNITVSTLIYKNLTFSPLNYILKQRL